MVSVFDDVCAGCNRLRAGAAKTNYEICQILGAALGYPKYEDDPANFPSAKPGDGVCVGDHVAETLAEEAAKVIHKLRAQNEQLRKVCQPANAG